MSGSNYCYTIAWILHLGIWSILSCFLWSVLDVWLDLCFCMWMSFCSSTIYWRDYLCFIVLPLLHCARSVDHYLSGSISELCILLYWYICLFLFLFSPKQTVFLTITLCHPCILGVSIVFFFNKCSLFQSFVAPCKFHNQFANIHKITFSGLDWVTLGRTDILTILSLLIHEQGIFLHLFSWFCSSAFMLST